MAKLLLATLAMGVIAWAGYTKYLLWQKVEALPETKSHDFIVTPTDSPVLVIAKQSSQPAELESLTILKADLKDRSVVALSLPTTISDGTTSVAQYAESHYYKEMQLALEGQLALPLTGYIIQPRVNNPTGNASLADAFNLSNPPNWWSTTIGLPLWLNTATTVSTNLSEIQLLQLAWLIRDLQLDKTAINHIPADTQKSTDGMLQLIPEKIDAIVQDLFISGEVKSEGTSVVVKNATHVDGLAALASRFVANMGGEVVAIEPADTAQTSSSIAAEKESSLTLSVSQFLGIPISIEPRTGRERADVQFIIGTDALARLGR